MFTTIFVKPIFNLLVFIYTILPGHNFGLAIIIFTIIIRLLMWPLVKRQLHQAKVMRQIQPELKRIKKEAKGNRQKEAQLQMELYRERGINPFASIVTLIPQIIILIALFSGLNRVVHDPHAIVNFAYPGLQHMAWMQQVAHNIHLFDNTLFGVVNLTKSALGKGGVYWPAMVIVIASAVTQYYMSKQLMPQQKNARKLRDILKAAGEGQQADQAEVNAAVGRGTRFLFPAFIFIFTVNYAAALSLYWFMGNLVAVIQQYIVLREDETEMEALAEDGKPTKDVKAIPEAEVITPPKKTKNKKKKSNKRRKR
ncbi:MAG TPA: YidC/Oxa1 family membrane protein insertase [Candidatus Saccharimonadales bacterium]|nr:YidC/Oxa1 family membrane protein insertase [Candidatus Saccharimonadales bacterium]